jgi:methyl-accepting chemotaxis protein
MKLGAKLLVPTVLAATLVFSIATVNTTLLRGEVQSNQERARADLESMHVLGDVQEQIDKLHIGLFRTLALPEGKDAEVKAFRDSLGTQIQGLKGTLDKAGQASAYGDQFKGKVQAMSAQFDAYREQAEKAISSPAGEGSPRAAALQSAETAFNGLSKGVDDLLHGVEEATVSAVAASDRRSQTTSWVLIALGLFSAAGAVALSWWMQRKIVKDLVRAVDVAHEVSRGNLAADVKTDRSDEVGDLMRALAAMSQQLSTSLQTVLQSSASIQSASAEIATGNQDLSQRTEQTASNLQMTASSMEQLTGTVKQSADSARQANQLASSAAEVAARGGAVVSQVVSTMDEINASSKKISDIIGVIDGIAFQTNILALNAAVEAARAGEQGRGFAVVASEVRSLAGRSAEAAKEIKGLIGASVERVEAGSRLVADAGQTMSEIVGSVQRVTDIIGEITAASAEQSDGIGQVTSSVTKLDQMTQQNAALVEQSAAAAESLKDQAGRLAKVVGAFRLLPSGKHGAVASAPPVLNQAVATPPARPAPAASKPKAPATAPAKVVKAAAAVAAPVAVAAGASHDDDWETF